MSHSDTFFYKMNFSALIDFIKNVALYFFHFLLIPYSTEIFRQCCRNILWEYCKSNKIFRNLSLILLKYCSNVAMPAHNMTYVKFLKYYEN